MGVEGGSQGGDTLPSDFKYIEAAPEANGDLPQTSITDDQIRANAYRLTPALHRPAGKARGRRLT